MKGKSKNVRFYDMSEEKKWSEEYYKACEEMREALEHFDKRLATDPEMREWIEKMRKVANASDT